MGGSHRVGTARFFCCCIVRQGFNKNLYPQSAYMRKARAHNRKKQRKTQGYKQQG